MKKNSDPTREQINELTAEIRALWSPAERMRRLRPDLRPSRRLADGRMHDIGADDYADHHSERERLQGIADP